MNRMNDNTGDASVLICSENTVRGYKATILLGNLLLMFCSR